MFVFDNNKYPEPKDKKTKTFWLENGAKVKFIYVFIKVIILKGFIL